MFKGIRRRLASRVLAKAAQEYTAAAENFSIPLDEALARMNAAKATMRRASARLLELSR